MPTAAAKTPKISVIVPVYNVAPYLAKCLEHLIYQTYAALEIIIVDDGSTDGSDKIYAPYAKKNRRIKTIKQKNAGVAAARNAGLRAATGEYVHFMDGDDFIDLDFYEALVGEAERTGADIAAGSLHRIGTFKYGLYHESGAILLSLQDKIQALGLPKFSHTPPILFRRALLSRSKLFFTPGITMMEDAIFTLPAVKAANKVVVVPGVSYNYFTREGSAINTRLSPKKRADKKFAEAFVRKFLRDNNVVAAKEQYAVSERYMLPILNLTFFKIMRTEHWSEYYLFGIKIMRRNRKTLWRV